MKKKIEKCISKMTDNFPSNLRCLRNCLGELSFKSEYSETFLHKFVDEKYDEEKCFFAIQALLAVGLSPNTECYADYNFIQVALYTGYSESFILKIIEEALKYNLNVNHTDEDKDTIMHTAIYSDDYKDGVMNIYKLLCDNGFNTLKKCKEGRNLVDAMIYEKDTDNKYTNQDIIDFEKEFKYQESKLRAKIKDIRINLEKENRNTIANKIELSDKDKKELEQFGKILNDKNYLYEPAIGREDELKRLIVGLARDKKNPLIIGESGVGKTAIVDELAYRIQRDEVPNFLKNKVIYEIDPSEIVKDTEYRGSFEANLLNVLKIVEKNNILLFIDEIHTIYGIGMVKDTNAGMESILKKHIDRDNLKVIGTTTLKEYEEFFSQDALKRRFATIKILEPIDEVLYKIVNKVLNDYSLKNAIFFENDNIREQIAKIIIENTGKKSRKYDDEIKNPDLSMLIIDDAFAIAKTYDCENITPQHFIEAFEWSERLYDFTKKRAMDSLKNIVSTRKEQDVPKEVKVLKLDFKKIYK